MWVRGRAPRAEIDRVRGLFRFAEEGGERACGVGGVTGRGEADLERFAAGLDGGLEGARHAGGVTRHGDRGVHEHGVGPHLHRLGGLRGGAEAGVHDDGDAGLFEDDLDLGAGLDPAVGADGRAEGHDGGAARILQAQGEHGVGIDVGEDGEALLHEDLGSGEGFGSAILADGAASVVGVDIAEDAVEHAILNYQGGVLSFKVASATDLSAFPDGSFDVVVSFEVIEHVAEQDEVLKEIARVMTDEGLLIMSSPDRAAYQRASPEPNPFHERELSLPELEELIEKTFPHSRYFAQRTIEGSRIVALDGNLGGSSLPVQIELAGDEWQIVGPPAPKYYVLAASRAGLPELPGTSTLADFGLQLMRSFEKQAILARADADALEHDKRALLAAVEHEKNEQQRLLAVLEERQAAWKADRAAVAKGHAVAGADHDSEQAGEIATLTNEAVESVALALVGRGG